MKIVYIMSIDTDGMSAPPSIAPGLGVCMLGQLQIYFWPTSHCIDSQMLENVYRGSDNLEESVYTWSLQ